MDSKMITVTCENHASRGSTEFAIRTIPFAYRMKEREDLPPWFGPLGEMEQAISKWMTKKHVSAVLVLAIEHGKMAVRKLSELFCEFADQGKRAGAAMDLLALALASAGRQCERVAIAAEEMRITLLTLCGPLGRNELAIQDGLRRILDANGPYLTFLDLAFGYSFVEITPEMCEYPRDRVLIEGTSELRETLGEPIGIRNATGTEDKK